MAKIHHKTAGVIVDVPADHPYITGKNPEWEVLTLEDEVVLDIDPAWAEKSEEEKQAEADATIKAANAEEATPKKKGK